MDKSAAMNKTSQEARQIAEETIKWAVSIVGQYTGPTAADIAMTILTSEEEFLSGFDAPTAGDGENNLFQKGNIKLNSGIVSDFKIDCDALTDKDLECIAYLISKRFKFRKVFGVPNGGLLLCEALQQYCIEDKELPVLICDDVLTTGGSMEKFKRLLEEQNVIGVVVFNRGNVNLSWVHSLFIFNDKWSKITTLNTPKSGELEKRGVQMDAGPYNENDFTPTIYNSETVSPAPQNAAGDNWISCEGEKPKKIEGRLQVSEDVLLWIPDPNNFCVKGFYSFREEEWHDIFNDVCDPSHWMPLPSPPTATAEQDKK